MMGHNLRVEIDRGRKKERKKEGAKGKRKVNYCFNFERSVVHGRGRFSREISARLRGRRRPRSTLDDHDHDDRKASLIR